MKQGCLLPCHVRNRVPPGPNQFDETVVKVTTERNNAFYVIRPNHQHPLVSLLGRDNMSFGPGTDQWGSKTYNEGTRLFLINMR